MREERERQRSGYTEEPKRERIERERQKSETDRRARERDRGAKETEERERQRRERDRGARETEEATGTVVDIAFYVNGKLITRLKINPFVNG